MLDRFIAERLGGEFLFLQLRVSRHSPFLIIIGQNKHAVIQGVESRERHKLEFVAHASKFLLKPADCFHAQMGFPIKRRRAIVGQKFSRVFFVNGLREGFGFSEVRL